MGITWWASRRTRTASDFYTAGGGITGFQNGLAIAGDYMSAATLLGITAMTYSQGFDGYMYAIAFFVGWPVILFLMAERLRNLGRFTFADITSYRLDQGKVRTMAALSSLDRGGLLPDRPDGRAPASSSSCSSASTTPSPWSPSARS